MDWDDQPQSHQVATKEEEWSLCLKGRVLKQHRATKNIDQTYANFRDLAMHLSKVRTSHNDLTPCRDTEDALRKGISQCSFQEPV